MTDLKRYQKTYKNLQSRVLILMEFIRFFFCEFYSRTVLGQGAKSSHPLKLLVHVINSDGFKKFGSAFAERTHYLSKLITQTTTSNV